MRIDTVLNKNVAALRDTNLSQPSITILNDSAIKQIDGVTKRINELEEKFQQIAHKIDTQFVGNC